LLCLCAGVPSFIFVFFFFNDTATTEIYTLSLHDALPIYAERHAARGAVLHRLLINQAAGSPHWLQVRLEQQPGNRQGIGALVGIERVGKPTLWRRVKTDGSYASASDSRIQAGLGESAAIAAVVVHWPDGGQERWTGIQADRLVTLRRGTGQMLPAGGEPK